MIKNLEIILSEASAITARRANAQERIAQITSEKDVVVANASGPDDAAALKKLNVLISQEIMAANQLKLATREEEGVKCRLLNESNHVRKGVVEALQEERSRLINRLEGRLEEFYPVARELKEVVQHLHSGAGVLQVPALYEIGRHLSGFQSHNFNRREQTEFAWAKSICNSAKRALAFIEANKSR